MTQTPGQNSIFQISYSRVVVNGTAICTCPPPMNHNKYPAKRRILTAWRNLVVVPWKGIMSPMLAPVDAPYTTELTPAVARSRSSACCSSDLLASRKRHNREASSQGGRQPTNGVNAKSAQTAIRTTFLVQDVRKKSGGIDCVRAREERDLDKQHGHVKCCLDYPEVWVWVWCLPVHVCLDQCCTSAKWAKHKGRPLTRSKRNLFCRSCHCRAYGLV